MKGSRGITHCPIFIGPTTPARRSPPGSAPLLSRRWIAARIRPPPAALTQRSKRDRTSSGPAAIEWPEATKSGHSLRPAGGLLSTSQRSA